MDPQGYAVPLGSHILKRFDAKLAEPLQRWSVSP
jgi:hypothetical protein